MAEEQEKTLKPLWPKGFLLVEHRRFELLTPTLPVLCATNCANAPSTLLIIHLRMHFVNPFFPFFVLVVLIGLLEAITAF